MRWALGKTIKLAPCAPLSYVIDGAVPKMPIAKSLRHYKTPRWCPVVMRPVGARDSKSRAPRPWGHQR